MSGANLIEKMAAIRKVRASADPLQMKLGYALAVARDRRGWTFAEVAARVAEFEGKEPGSVAPTSVFHIEVGRSWPKPGRLRALAAVLEVPVHRLLDAEYVDLPTEARQALDTVRDSVVARYEPQVRARREHALEELKRKVAKRAAADEEE